jgi:hypothetical protein
MIVQGATAEEVVAYIGMWGWVMSEDAFSEPLAFGGFWRHSGRLWGFLHVFKAVPPSMLVRTMKRKLEELGEEAYVVRDSNHASSEKLLRLIGLVETDEVIGGMRVWKWQTR